ncbi:MAG: ABC transporter permease [Candidatus Izemoplasma sp.]
MKKKQISINKIIPLISILFVLVLWESVTIIFSIDNYVLPRLTTVLKSLYENRSLVFTHARYTMSEAIIGLLIAVMISFITAVILDKFKKFQSFVYPIIAISQTIPLMAIAPLLIIWFGLGVDAKIMVVVLVCYFPITINILTGFSEIDQDELDLFKVMKASTKDLYLKLKIPSSLPYFFSGLRIATTYAVLGALIAEYMGGKFGLGIYLSRAMRSYSTEMVFGIIIVIVVSTLAMLAIVQLLERIYIKYKIEEN